MKFLHFLVMCVSLVVSTAGSFAQESVADVFADPSLDMKRPADRARAVERIRAIENAGLERARLKANAKGIPMRWELPDGTVHEIMGLDEIGEFQIYTTLNANAAISSAANQVYPAPYNLDGTDVTVGVWDGGAVLVSHVEFQTSSGSRVTVRDGTSALSSHGTHVAGTVAASGVRTDAKGMAPNAFVDSYNWTSDDSEMITAGAITPREAGKILISNHSYGFSRGWGRNSQNVQQWYGTGTNQNAYASQFGQYSSKAYSWDNISYNAPYYLIFHSAGNDNSDNPANGAQVVIGGSTVTYDRTIHPPGDGLYRNTTTNSTNGYENIGDQATSKNIMVIGAANDAVSGGQRSPASGTLSGFSSRGPTDDGRIKPDIVANGVGLTSTVSSGDTNYGGSSGTSMSSPSAAGSAALLVQLYRDLFPGEDMRASTLKAVILHTATDIGNPGPDYHYGWGLMNTKDAADQIIAHQSNPALNQIVENQLTTSTTTQSYDFGWDGTSPIRATIAWTDPAGTSTTAHDSRISRLVNNLDLKIIAPNGTQYYPFVMPFVGTWTVASMSSPATTGVNNTDNVEQVLISNPAQPGVWRAEVTYTGSLTTNAQNYSLVLSGVEQQADEQAPTPDPMTWALAPAPVSGSDTEITMTATTASDPSGVQYYFTETSGNPGGSDSGWQNSPTYTATGLFPATQYTFTVTARDTSSQLNATAASAPASATTTGLPDTTPPNPDPMTFASFPSASGSSSIIMTAAIANDPVGVEYYFAETSGNPGGNDSGWQDSPSYEDTGLNSGTGYSYTVTARDKSPNQNATAPSAVATGYTQSLSDQSNLANADIAVSGNVSGTYINTQTSNNSYQQLTEIEPSGNPNNRYSYLEHKWSFNVTGGSSVTFHVEAHHTANPEGDDFVFAYSTNGVNGTYTNMVTVTKTADDNTTQTFALPQSTSGVVHVRVRDLDQSAGNRSFDSLFIDSMYFVSSSGGGNNNPPTLVSITDNQSGGPVEFNSVVNYTVNFSKDMDSGTVSAADFGNAGTSSVSIGTVTESSPGIFSVPVTPTSTGTLRLQINSGADLRDVAGTALNTASALADDLTIEVTGLTADLALGNLNQTYDGNPKSISVTTTPGGLAHSVSYDGSPTPPTNAGSYPIVATITDPNYTGSTNGTLVIAKSAQTINFAALSAVGDDQTPFALTATATSGLTVSYASSEPTVASVSGSTVTVNNIGITTITASQSGNANYLAATDVQQDLTVVRSTPLAAPGGPYKVLFGQALTLNGGASESSFGATITNYEWDLNNDSTFGDVTGATPSALSYSDITTTWGMNQGLNTIQLRITDSAGKTSTVSTTVEIVIGLTWDANGINSGQTDGGGAWLGTNLWWDDAANASWASGSSATFGNGGTGGAVTLASPTAINALFFNSFSGTYTLGTAGQTLTISEGITKNAGSGAVTITSPVNLGAIQTWTNNSTNALAVSGNVDNGGYELFLDGSGNVSLTGVISGAGGITMNGSGKVAFNTNNANSYTGTTSINDGILVMGNNIDSISNGNLTLNGGMLGFYWGAGLARTLGDGPGEVQLLGGISGFGGEGTTGPTINLGSTILWGASGEGAATGFFNPTKFALGSDYTTNAATTTFSSGIDLNGSTRTILVNDGINGNVRVTISGALSNSSGTAGLIKEGGGILNLTNNSSSWNGPTTVSEGILDFGGININNIGGGSSRNISVAAGTAVRFNALTNGILNRIVETSDEITIMTGTTANNLDFSSSTGANLPEAFLGNWAGNGAKCEYSGTITPATDAYRFGSSRTTGLLGITNTSTMSGSQGLIVGGGSVELVGPKTFTGNTVILTDAKLGLAAITGGNGVALGLQNSALNLGSTGGKFWLESGSAAGAISGSVATTSAVFGGLIGSRNLVDAYSTSTGANNSAATALSNVTGFTLNPGSGADYEYSGTIADFATGTSITKTGLGTQVLSGTNTYTGTTTVSAGKLIIDGSLSNVAAAFNVANAATIGGAGTIGRNVTIEDGGELEFNISTSAASHTGLTISSGRDFAFTAASELTITSAGGALPGVYTLVTGGNNITGTAPATVNLPPGWIANVSISGNSLLLNVTSTSGAGSVDHFAISGLPSETVIGTALTGITITAQDAADETATSFTGTVTFGGTAGITGTTANFVNGVLSGVSVTPTIAGSNLTFTVDDGAGHTGSALITVQSIFDDWAGNSGLIGDDALTGADPDKDGITNLMEFAFGLNPNSPPSGQLSFVTDGDVTVPGVPVLMNFASESEPADYRAVFVRRKDYQSAGLTYTVHFSADLTMWTSSATPPTRLTNINSVGELEAVSVPFPATVPVTIGGSDVAPTFFHLEVTNQ